MVVWFVRRREGDGVIMYARIDEYAPLGPSLVVAVRP